MTTMRVLGDQLHSEYKYGPHYTKSLNGSVARRCLNLGSYNYLGFGGGEETRLASSCTEQFQTSDLSFPNSHFQHSDFRLPKLPNYQIPSHSRTHSRHDDHQSNHNGFPRLVRCHAIPRLTLPLSAQFAALLRRIALGAG